MEAKASSAVVPDSVEFKEFLSALQTLDESIPLKAQTRGVEGCLGGLVVGGVCGGLASGPKGLCAGIVVGGLLGALFGIYTEEDQSKTPLSNQYSKLSLDEKEVISNLFLEVQNQSVPPIAEPLSFCSNSHRMTSLQLYNFSGAPGTPWQNVKVYRRSMLNAVLLAADIEANRVDVTTFHQRLNQGLGGDFWTNVSQPTMYTFTYGTGKKKEKKQKPVVVALASNGYQVLVAFYGTSSGRDWLTNFKVPSKSIPFGGEAHMGFVDAAESCKDQMLQKIRSLVPRGRDLSSLQVIFVGHSLGGGVSALAGLHTLEALALDGGTKLNARTNSQNNVAILTMGQPRVWRRGLFTPFSEITEAHKYESLIGHSNLLRLVASKNGKNSNDFVTHTPPEFLEYVHIGHLRNVKMDPKVAKLRGRAFHDLTIYDYAIMNDPNI